MFSFSERIYNFLEAKAIGRVVALLCVSTSILSVGYSLAFYRIPLSPLCRFHSRPNCQRGLNPLHPGVTELYANNVNFGDQEFYTADVSFSVNTLSLLIGLCLAAKLVNCVGRVRTIAISTLPNFLAWVVVLAFQYNKTPALLFTAELLCSFSAGLAILSTIIYTVEISSNAIYSCISCLFSLCLALGFVIGWVLHIQTEPIPMYIYYKAAPQPRVVIDSVEVFEESFFWRTYSMYGIAISLASLLATTYLPLSPYWLILTSDKARALQSLKTLTTKYADHHKELASIQTKVGFVWSSNLVTEWIGYVQENKRTFLFILSIIFLQQLGGVNVIPSYLEALHEYTYKNGETAAAFAAYLVLSVSLISAILRTLVSCKCLLLTSAFFATCSCVAYSSFLYLELDKLKINQFAVRFLYACIISQWIGGAQLMPVVRFVAHVPVSLRGMACCICFSLMILTLYTIFMLKLYISCFLLFFCFSISNILLLFVLLLYKLD